MHCLQLFKSSKFVSFVTESYSFKVAFNLNTKKGSLCFLAPGPGPDPQFVFTGPGPQFVFTSPGQDFTTTTTVTNTIYY